MIIIITPIIKGERMNFNPQRNNQRNNEYNNTNKQNSYNNGNNKYRPPSMKNRNEDNKFRKKYSDKPNVFKKNNNNLKNTKLQFNIESENFPELNNTLIINEKIEKTTEQKYLKTTQKTIETISEKDKEKQSILPGYTILYHKTNETNETNKTNETNETNKTNEYFAPWRSRLIMENRLKHRLELNDILGDISPYWNTDLYGDEVEEDDYINYYEEEDEDDYESYENY